LPRYDYGQPGAYFVTVVAAGRERLFGDVVAGAMRLNALGEIVDACWSAIPDHHPGVALDVHVVMPNHLHGIIVIRGVGARHAVPTAGSATTPRHDAPPPGSDAAGDGVAGAGARHAVPLRGGDDGSDRVWTTDDLAVGGSEGFGRPAEGTVPTIVRSFKSATTRLVNGVRGTPGAPVWQRNYYEHIIRHAPALDPIRLYIADNPRHWASDRFRGPAGGGG